MKRKRVVVFMLLGIFLFGFIGLYTISIYHPRQFNQLRYYVTHVIKQNSPTPASYHSKIKRDRYALHVISAENQSIRFIDLDSDIHDYIDKGRLVNISNSKGFRIHKLSHSEPVLSEKAKSILLKIGSEFNNKTRGQYFTVTSLTRSNESQKKLRKVNSNASKGISSHCYGASFDISYVRFNGRKGNNQVLQKELEDLLIKFQKQNKIYVIYERQRRCYHVTTR